MWGTETQAEGDHLQAKGRGPGPTLPSWPAEELTLLALDTLNLDIQPPELGDSKCLWSKPPCVALGCRSPGALRLLGLGKNAFLLNLKISAYNLTLVSLGK